MGVSSSLLTDSQDDGASPWHVVAIVLQVVGAMERLMMYVAEGGSKRPSTSMRECANPESVLEKYSHLLVCRSWSLLGFCLPRLDPYDL